ncbi:MAG: HD-GYP domain-containing protein [Actinomycetota bacterium]|nr:HD-GYP domain-containing protein [Actinomycetota bacterium]
MRSRTAGDEIKTDDHVDVRPYLSRAIVATGATIGGPLVATAVLAWVASPHPPIVVDALIFLVLAIAAISIGATIWHRNPASADVSFDELMLWGWMLRNRLERKLERGTSLLGLDREGRPVENVQITPGQQLAVLQELTTALEGKDPYTHGHSQRVSRHVYRTALAMGLPPAEVEELRTAATLHDVGKIRVPDRILRKPSDLSAYERQIVQEHVVVGAWMVSLVTSVDVVAAVRHHHERWDGFGYPDGLAATEIPLFARIISVADTYDAITSSRPYRPGASRDEAIEILQQHAGTQFDPDVVAAFVSTLPVRVPVTGVLALLAAPQAWIRRAAAWLKRWGLGNVAPAAGGVGAAVLLAAVVPGLPGFHALQRPHTPNHRVVVAPPTRSNAQVSALHIKRTTERSHVASAKAHGPNAAPKKRSQHGTAHKADAHRGTTTVDGRSHHRHRQTTTTPSPGATSGSPKPHPTHPSPPPAASSPAPSATPKGDPQPDHGHDCDHDEQGPGNEKHCG